MTNTNENIRNIAIIAHVDHGKTTLVDCLLKQAGAFRDNQQVQERVLDSNDLERERGITILSKNISINYKNTKINVVDTPGHADFGGEVERVLGMVDGALLIVDAAEGPMPQTRFVLSKALELGLKIIVVINKIDKPAAEPLTALDKVFDLFTELTDREDLIDFPFIFASSLNGFAIKDLDDERKDMIPLLDCILENIKPPKGDAAKPFQFRATTLDYNDYVGRIVIGRIENGKVKSQEQVCVIHADGSQEKGKITKLFGFHDLGRTEIQEASAGDIVGIAGFADVQIGESICSLDNPQPLPLIKVDEPTLQMNFSVNDSPFAGTEGKFVTSRQLRKRLYDELEKNVSLRVEDTDSTDVFRVSGRGELHLGILIETMRREGYEFQVSKPEVIYKTIDGKQCEPYENLIVDVPEEYAGSCIDRLSGRKAEMKEMSNAKGRTTMTFHIPARGLIGFRSEFIRMTRGEGIMYHTFLHYRPYAGDIPRQRNGSIIAHEQGEAIPYALAQFEDRGTFFVTPKTKVYRGMIIGECNKPQDIVVNICKTKKLTNMRSATADVMVTLQAHKEMSLEECLEYIADDELVEITPENVRIRKADLNKKIYN
ncbi:translational GTPase TypA [Spirochaetes bacterium]|uniref:Large ribosomal subunit assembly factor BipA n=1 Tax=Candidatus Scatousia excrementipullorum TaxID=2840936 RepID=A0A9D9DMY6_9BACT|nr:translational GTPase TypA [Candidatus Scatousia excrementipullorum]